jgi:hypothetical protein
VHSYSIHTKVVLKVTAVNPSDILLRDQRITTRSHPHIWLQVSNSAYVGIHNYVNQLLPKKR